MKSKKWDIVKWIAIPLLVGAAAGLLTREGMKVFEELNKPPLSPPGWLFPVVWTVLYVLMGISAYLISVSDSEPWKKNKALSIYGYQLAANFLWPMFFFNFQWYFFSFLWLILLWILIAIMIKEFWDISKLAAYLNIPYLIWVTFACYLNLGIWLLN